MKIGCDLVLISRIAKLSESASFLAKVFHADEVTYCNSRGVGKEASLAARFAAKEAFGKALGTGIFSQGVNPVDIWITNDSNGRPVLNLSHSLRDKVAELGFSSWDISLSHQGEYALATVVLF